MKVVAEVIIAILLILAINIYFYKKDKKKRVIISLSTFIMTCIVIFFTIALEPPKINSTQTIQIEVNSKNKLENPRTEYMFHDVTSKIKIHGNVDYSKIGTYEIEYEVPTILGSYTEKQTIEVVDTTPPIITLNGEEKIQIPYNQEYLEQGAIVTDNYDQDISKNIKIEKIQINEDEFQMKYSVTDSEGNSTQKIRYITLIDNIAPVLTLNGKEKMTIILGNKYKEQGAKAYDEKDGDLTEKINIEGNVDTSKIGTYTIMYTVTDTKGNKATKERIIKVVNKAIQNNPSNGANKVIYLTFDDGPGPYTNELLDILQKYNVKATFFVTNQSITSGYDEVIKRAYEEGHTIGLHSYTHNYKKIYASEEAYFEDLYAIQQKVKEITGYESNIIRFPGGSSNTVSRFNPGIMTRLSNEVTLRGFYYFDWNISSGDAGNVTTAGAVINNVMKSLGKSKNNVVLQHDIKRFSVDAVESIIEYGLANGYTFQALTPTSPAIHHGINN